MAAVTGPADCCFGRTLRKHLAPCGEPVEITLHMPWDTGDGYPVCAGHRFEIEAWVVAQGGQVGPACAAGLHIVRKPGPGGEFASWQHPCRAPTTETLHLARDDGSLVELALCPQHAAELDEATK